MRHSRRDIFHFRRKEAFKEGKGIKGGKMHLRREDAFKEDLFGWDKQGILGGKFLVWTYRFQKYSGGPLLALKV